MQALMIDKHNDSVVAEIRTLSPTELPAGEVTVDIHWSSLNYKDALAITNQGKIIQAFPMVPGIDLAGVVSHSEHANFTPGQSVLLTGWGVGERHWGGLAEQARVKAEWLLPLPKGMSLRQSMSIGTAGLTAMLCVLALQEGGVTPEQGCVLVTGASGGVGSTAVTLLTALGYSVTALTGRQENHAYLRQLGAHEVISRESLLTLSRPLEKQRWAGAIDTVGGNILAALLAQTHYNGTVAACGLAQDFKLNTTVMPFILRNVRLQGVDSVTTPNSRRQQAWQKLAELLPPDFYTLATQEITLSEVLDTAKALLNNQITGRTLVKMRQNAG